jgi:hypothetical protein
LTNEKVTFFPFSLTLASLTLVPLTIGLCVGALVAGCETLLGAALSHCVTATNVEHDASSAVSLDANAATNLLHSEMNDEFVVLSSAKFEKKSSIRPA